jgi:two-component system, OmpR family, sensor kinase
MGLADRLGKLSLRVRLVAVLLILLLLSCGLVAAATTLALHRFLLQRLDQQLVAAGNRFSISLEHPGDGDSDDAQLDSVVGQAAGTLGARTFGGRIAAIDVVAGGSEHPPPSARDRAVVAALQVSSGPRTVNLPDLGGYRVIATGGQDGDVLITGLPLDQVADTTSRLVAIEAVVFAVALLLTGVAGAACVRLSLRPLTRVGGTALRVSHLPLSSGEVSLPERVANPAPGTEVGQVAEAFNHMLEHVETALRMRHASEDRLRHFVADASHELRTPIAVIRSHTEYAQRAGSDLAEPVEQALVRIGAESERMGHLVEDLLLLTRLDSGRPLARDEVDLSLLAIDAVSDARVAGSDHSWQLDLPDEPVLVHGDEHALHQVIANLLSNARTHTPAGTTVLTEVTETSGTVALHVRDDGPGIPAHVLPHVFERFVRADNSRSRASGSTGLGLSIVAAVVHAHGATIDVRSRPGRTEFVVRLDRPP